MELKLESGMYVRCAWCKKYENISGEFVVADNVDPSVKVTDTCCDKCMAKILAEIGGGE
jgi:hypothetical protein